MTHHYQIQEIDLREANLMKTNPKVLDLLEVEALVDKEIDQESLNLLEFWDAIRHG